MEKRPRISGFSLIELLTALTVLSVALLSFGSMVYSLMNSVSRSKKATIEIGFAPKDSSSIGVFRAAEAGLQDARSRLQTGAGAFPIQDPNPSNPGWMAFIGPAAKTIEKGYQSRNREHFRLDRLDPALDYVVAMRHKVDGSGKVLKWGDCNNDGRPEENTTVGESIYVVTSEGYDGNRAARSLRIEAARMPPIRAAAALYTKAEATLQGSSTHVQGLDPCGSRAVPGVLSMERVKLYGLPAISGFPSAIVEYSPLNIDVRYLLNQFKRRANYQYNVDSATLEGMDWGSPVRGATPRDPSGCGLRNVVYFNTNNTYVKLSGDSHGCGVLLVEGDLSVHGGFQWYGMILVTGSIAFTGGGGKNVTGAVMAEGKVSAVLVEGDGNILFCSRAVHDQTSFLPAVILRRAETFS